MVVSPGPVCIESARAAGGLNKRDGASLPDSSGARVLPTAGHRACCRSSGDPPRRTAEPGQRRRAALIFADAAASARSVRRRNHGQHCSRARGMRRGCQSAWARARPADRSNSSATSCWSGCGIGPVAMRVDRDLVVIGGVAQGRMHFSFSCGRRPKTPNETRGCRNCTQNRLDQGGLDRGRRRSASIPIRAAARHSRSGSPTGSETQGAGGAGVLCREGFDQPE